MGGSIAPAGGPSVLQVPPAVAGASGGGPTVLQVPPTVAPPPTPPPLTGGGPSGGDVAGAVAALQGAVAQLAAAIQAMQGAGQVSGGGGSPAQTGCGCGGASTAAPPAPSQYTGEQGANAAPTAPPTSPGDDAPAGGGARDRIVAAAKAELAKGVKEDAGSDTDKAGNIVRYRGAVTGAGENPKAAEPWCADFASWVWKQAGVPFGPEGKGSDYTPQMIEQAKKMNSWHARGSYEPKPGDLVMIDWGGGQDVDHVAVVVEVKDGRVHTIGGNESDSLKSSSYPMNDARMMGFISPKGA